MKKGYKLPPVISFNVFELGQLMAVMKYGGKYENIMPSLKRKLTRKVNSFYK